MKKSLTVPYALHQMVFCVIAAGTIGFATAFLLEKNFTAANIGLLLALGNLLSCGAQPFLADLADRLGVHSIRWIAVGLSLVSTLCFAAIQLLSLPKLILGILYLAGIFAFDAMNPLLNAIAVAYVDEGYRVNYGIGRAMGAFAYSLAALLIGKIMASHGGDGMLWICLAFLGINTLICLAYPRLNEKRAQLSKPVECCSVPQFFVRYKWYCLSLLGVMLLAMVHSMTESYLIEIVTPLGGDSSSVGTALAIATFSEAAVLLVFDRIRRRISDFWLMKIAGISFVTKAVLFLLATNVASVCAIQVLQATSYTFLSPVQMYYANRKIASADMVKGQAFITAAYTLGCAAGNFAGGQLISIFHVKALLYAAVAMAVTGTVIFFLTLEKEDK